MRDVAELADVSVGTVSNVLNRPERVSEAVVARVHDAIRELGYVRNDAARQLRAGRSSSVGLVVLDARNPFFTDIARGAGDEASAHGVSVLLGDSDQNLEREAAYLDLFEEQRVRGVLVSPLGDEGERLERLRAHGTPVVLVDRRADGGVLSSVSVDDVAGGRIAVEHLLDLGRRRVAFVAGPLGIRQVGDRLAGAREAVGAVPDARLEVLEGASLSVFEGRRIGEQLLARDAAERPDAVFAANDLLAVGLLQALVMAGGLRVPDDIAIVGFDDIDFAEATIVALSSVRQPSRLIGQTALRILLEEADDPTLAPRQVVFQPELITRASSRPLR
ncbi:LacI family transcriptional regulator [Homoserinibacter sp. GY 40078]|nr:LacI family transcriptional regulator [Homoserinibacter sp. GY 40078]